MNKIESIDIDDQEDYEFAKVLSKKFIEYKKWFLKLKKVEKNYIISEHGGWESADIMLHDLYFVVTKKKENLFVILKEKTLKAVAFFNLLDDPKEQNNLVDKIEYKRKINSLLENLHTERGEIINQRLKSQ